MGMYDETVEVARRTMVLFFVVDTSGSMDGTKIGAVNQAIREVIPEIADISASNADAEIKIAAMSFSCGAQWLTEKPVEAESYRWDDVDAAGCTDLGEAYSKLAEKLSRSAFMKETSGSYAPAIFLISDGCPTDDYSKGLSKLKENKWFQNAIRVALAIGDDADRDVLKEFTGSTETVLVAHTPEVLRKLIRFVSVTSSKIGSKSTSTRKTDEGPTGISSDEGSAGISSKMEEFAAALSDATGDILAGDAVEDDFD